MDASEFWCRAFLAEMNGACSRTMVNWEHERAADRFEKAADAALAVAQRRGMVTVERAADAAPVESQATSAKPERVDRRQRWTFKPTRETFGVWELYAPGNVAALRYQLRDGHVRKMDLAASVLLSSDDWEFAGIDPETRAAPELERVEFKATPDDLKPGWWRVLVPDVGVFVMLPGDESVTRTDGSGIRIKWGESMPPQPIEVWIERPAKGGA